MKLEQVFPNLNLNKRLAQMPIRGLSDDSRSVNKGDIFFVIKRRNFDIFSVLRDIESKVSVFVGGVSSRQELESIVRHKPIILVKNIKKEFYRVVDLFYGFRKNNLKIIGVTGTNGKTTTSFLIYYLLKKMGQRASLVGTVKYLIGTKIQRADYTTPGFLALRKILKRIKDQQSRFVIMEVSSHAIAQERVKGIVFSRCVFTNLSRDHLDYHKTMSNYFNIKRKLFLDNSQTQAFINIDDNYGRKLFKELNSRSSYGTMHEADFRAENIIIDKGGCRFDVRTREESFPVRTQLCGRHNVLNILGALSVVSSLGFSLSKAIKFIPHFFPVEGRLEEVGEGIFVDYAHTPEALKNVLLALRETGYKKIFCVFGCGGDRDKGKRKLMGKIACRWADFTFITSDNPRSESAGAVCRQIEKGFRKKNYSIVVDRKKAIKKAIEFLYQGNPAYGRTKKYREICVLIAGKGHEEYQIVGDKKIPFKDSYVIKQILRKKTLNSKPKTKN